MGIGTLGGGLLGLMLGIDASEHSHPANGGDMGGALGAPIFIALLFCVLGRCWWSNPRPCSLGSSCDRSSSTLVTGRNLAATIRANRPKNYLPRLA